VSRSNAAAVPVVVGDELLRGRLARIHLEAVRVLCECLVNHGLDAARAVP
jgi:hypothetical protein